MIAISKSSPQLFEFNPADALGIGLDKRLKRNVALRRLLKGTNDNFPKNSKSTLRFISFLFLLILSHDNKQERAVMNNAAEILKSVQIGLDVCIFLLNTDRGLQATELCNECITLL